MLVVYCSLAVARECVKRHDHSGLEELASVHGSLPGDGVYYYTGGGAFAPMSFGCGRSSPLSPGSPTAAFAAFPSARQGHYTLL